MSSAVSSVVTTMSTATRLNMSQTPPSLTPPPPPLMLQPTFALVHCKERGIRGDANGEISYLAAEMLQGPVMKVSQASKQGVTSVSHHQGFSASSTACSLLS